MRAFICLLSLMLAVVGLGCVSSISRTRNGIEEYRVVQTRAPFVNSTEITQNTQKYPRAVAEYGPMPDSEEYILARQKVHAEHVRDVNGILYGGGYWGWGWGGGYYQPGYRRIIQGYPQPGCSGGFYTPGIPSSLPMSPQW